MCTKSCSRPATTPCQLLDCTREAHCRPFMLQELHARQVLQHVHDSRLALCLQMQALMRTPQGPEVQCTPDFHSKTATLTHLLARMPKCDG